MWLRFPRGLFSGTGLRSRRSAPWGLGPAAASTMPWRWRGCGGLLMGETGAPGITAGSSFRRGWAGPQPCKRW